MAHRIAVVALVVAGASLLACGDDGPSSPTGGAGGSGNGGASAGGAPGDGGGTTTGGGAGGDAGAGGSGGSGGSSAVDAIVHADFQQREPGVYSEDMVPGDFVGKPTWNNGLDEGRASIVDEAGNRFLRVTYPADEYGPANGGVQFKVPLGETYQELYLSYRVRFGNGFAFMKGGKLPGLVGGSAPTGCVEDTTGFSARMMWRTGGAAVQYMYFPEKVNDCGDDYDYMSGGSAVEFNPGTWHTVEHRLVMNEPGEHDGVLEAWFDKQQVIKEQAFLFRLAGATYGIDALYFSTFFGGSDSSWAPPSAQTVDYDDFIISTSPITH